MTTYIFLDNLRLHHSNALKDVVRRNNQELVFNASYSSPLNPIERLWAYAKKIFGRSMISDCITFEQTQVTAFVERSLIQVSSASLAKHVQHCLLRAA